MQRTLRRHCQDLAVTVRNVPEADGGFDVYLIDLDFGGKPLGPRLARQVRALKPGALIFAATAGIRREQVPILLDAGFDGICDKTVPQDLQTAAECVRLYMRLLQGDHAADARQWMAGARELFCAIQHWNQRLVADPENAGAHTSHWDSKSHSEAASPRHIGSRLAP